MKCFLDARRNVAVSILAVFVLAAAACSEPADSQPDDDPDADSVGEFFDLDTPLKFVGQDGVCVFDDADPRWCFHGTYDADDTSWFETGRSVNGTVYAVFTHIDVVEEPLPAYTELCALDSDGKDWCNELEDLHPLVEMTATEEGLFYLLERGGSRFEEPTSERRICQFDEDQRNWCVTLGDVGIDGVSYLHAAEDQGGHLYHSGTWCHLDPADGQISWCESHDYEPNDSIQRPYVRVLDDDHRIVRFYRSSTVGSDPEQVCELDDRGAVEWCNDFDDQQDSLVESMDVTDGGSTYVLFETAELCRLDEDGQLQWCNDMEDELSDSLSVTVGDSEGFFVSAEDESGFHTLPCKYDEHGERQWCADDVGTDDVDLDDFGTVGSVIINFTSDGDPLAWIGFMSGPWGGGAHIYQEFDANDGTAGDLAFLGIEPDHLALGATAHPVTGLPWVRYME